MKQKIFLDTNNAIDAVVSWVDGSNPTHQAKMKPFVNEACARNHPGANPSRFASVGEIDYCILSILRFAPFVRNIFVVTDAQDPKVGDLVAKHFPERVGCIKIIDHKVIFEGHEQYLPTFNSISIETMLWRIPGLADKFIYFNDDLFLLRPVSAQDFFIENDVVLRGIWNIPPWARMAFDYLKTIWNNRLLRSIGYKPRHSFQVTQWLSAKIAGFRWRYFLAGHNPHAFSRNSLETFFENNPGRLTENVSCRFREYNQFNIAALSYHLEIKAGNKNLAQPNVVYFKPSGRGLNYVKKKIELGKRNTNIKFACVQNLDKCSHEVQECVFAWLGNLVGINGS